MSLLSPSVWWARNVLKPTEALSGTPVLADLVGLLAANDIWLLLEREQVGNSGTHLPDTGAGDSWKLLLT